jgi:uncharacterized protein involved in exopolysaccharide biosynthesis
MSFNFRFPDVNPMDTMGLVKLMSDPQKATELWERYTALRETYEAQRASIAAENAALNDRLASAEKAESALADAKLEHERAVASFKSKVAVWEVKSGAAEAAVADRSLELDGRTTAVAAREVRLTAGEKKLAENQKALDALSQQTFDELRADEAALEVREAAVAKREKKADQLADLLKSV